MSDISLLVNESLQALLEAERLLDLDALFARNDLEVVKARLAVRQTFRLQTGDGRSLYVKRYTRPGREPFWNSFGARRFRSPASREYFALQKLAELGVPAPTPAACIEEVESGRVTRAALLTVGLPVEANLEQLAAQALPHGRRAAFARELGRLLRAMHEGGVNHRDFYLVHIRVGADDKLYVTDLNRADIRAHVPRRWRVKDVAALLHSTPPNVSTADKARFARAYLGSSLREHRAFFRAVKRKAARISAHTRKRVAAGEANYHIAE